ncbi:MAG: DinB family protein [Planctomycetota bacterium]
MSSAVELADAIGSTEELLIRFLEGFDETNATAQLPGLPNHAVWSLGHLALTMHRAAEQIAAANFPLEWNPEPFSFGSSPSGRRDEYPPLAEMIDRYRSSLALLLNAIRTAGDEGLGRAVSWGSGTITARDLAARMVFHNGAHCGQLADLRRGLGLGPVIR